MKEDLFNAMRGKEKLRCVSHDLGLNKFGEIYEVSHVVRNQFGNTFVYVLTKDGEECPWRNPDKFNSCFERAEKAAPTEDRPITGSPVFKMDNPKTAIDPDFFDSLRGNSTVYFKGPTNDYLTAGVGYKVAGIDKRLRQVLMEGTPVYINELALNENFSRDEPNPFVGASSKADNPKDLIGNTKLGLRHVPLGAIYEAAVAMDDGARKYGPFNWRDHPVRADVYTDAAKRHIDAWIHGEERADDSGAHHLGHAVACLLILMDAQHHDTLKDNRDKNARRFHDILDQIQKDRDTAKKVLDDKK